MRIVLVIQARVNSTRLPRKMLLPLAGKTILQHVVERCLRTQMPDAVVLAFPAGDAEIEIMTNKYKTLQWCRYQGLESDLVGRFAHVSRQFGGQILCRVPADNPCVDPDIIDGHIHKFLFQPTTFSSSQIYEHHGYCFDGLGTEICFANWYQYLDSNVTHRTYREHPHIYFQDRRLVDYPYCTNPNPQPLELHVNLQEEYELLKPAFEAVYAHHQEFPGVEVGKRVAAYRETSRV